MYCLQERALLVFCPTFLASRASVKKSSKIEFYGYFVNKIKMNRNLIIHTILAILALVLMITTAVLVPGAPEGCSYALINFTLIYAFILQILIMLYTLLVVLSNVVKEKYVKIYEFFLIAPMAIS